ncbi:hypothetical protein [Arabiibacter massiliensis]|uniref:hypothetical protein n=1 Tax=Arabiibacter massiliensis TaxID=1870985 RepID=UPI001179E2B4|nr:hypothetical protein [Arabiibacter massiliensis]
MWNKLANIRNIFTPRNIVKCIPALLSIASIIVCIHVGTQSDAIAKEQNALYQKYERLNSYTSPLSYQVDLSGEGQIIATPQNESEPYTINGNSIRITSLSGSVAKAYAVVYQKGVFGAIMPLELETSESIATHDPQDAIWVFNKFSVPIIGHSEDFAYGTLFLIILDYQGNYTTNMITFTFSETELVANHIYWPIDVLYTANDEGFNEQNLGSFESSQLKQYGDLLRSLSQVLGNSTER